MTEYEKLYHGIGKAAWGYLFILFDLKINEINLLPSFIGYLLFFLAIDGLCERKREAVLLQTFGVILAFWQTVAWAFAWIEMEGSWVPQLIDTIIGVCVIWFHFKFLTLLISVAEQHQPVGRGFDRNLRVYRAVLVPTMTFFWLWTALSLQLGAVGGLISIGAMILYMIVGICLMKTLFDLRRTLPTDPNRDAADPEP